MRAHTEALVCAGRTWTSRAAFIHRWTPRTPRLHAAMRDHFAAHRFATYDGVRSPFAAAFKAAAKGAKLPEEQRQRHTLIDNAFPSYGEESQSGEGVHIIVRGTPARCQQLLDLLYTLESGQQRRHRRAGRRRDDPERCRRDRASNQRRHQEKSARHVTARGPALDLLGSSDDTLAVIGGRR